MAGSAVHHRRWWPFQPANIVMAPDGDLWFHADGNPIWTDDFAASQPDAAAGSVHPRDDARLAGPVRRGRWWLPLDAPSLLPLRRARSFPAARSAAYGLEQQAEIVRHAFLAKRGATTPAMPPAADLAALIAFGR